MEKLTVTKLNTLTRQVEHCLDKYTNTRNSDLELFGKVCELFYPPFEQAIYNWRDLISKMYQVPDLNSIARSRRKVIALHKHKKFLPTDPKVAEARKINSHVWHDYALQNQIKLEKDFTLWLND